MALFCPQPGTTATAPILALAEDNAGGMCGARRSWALICSRRPHTHDVRALATSQIKNTNGESVPVLVSGGIDTQLAILRTDDFERATPLKLLPLPHVGSVSASAISGPTVRILSHDGAEISLWQLPS